MQRTVRGTGAGHLQRAQRVARDRLLRQLERQRVHCVRELAHRVDTEHRLLAAIAGSRSTAATLAGPVAAATAVTAAATAVTATTRPPVPRGQAERSSLVPGEVVKASDSKSSAVCFPGVMCESALRSDRGAPHRHNHRYPHHYPQHRLTSQSQPITKLSLPSPHGETSSMSCLNGYAVNHNGDEQTQRSDCLEDKHTSTRSKDSDAKHDHQCDDHHRVHQCGNRRHDRLQQGYRRIAQADLEETGPTYTGGDELRAVDGREELPLAFPRRHRSRQRRGRSPAAHAGASSGPRTGVRARRDEAARARKAERARRRRERITERTRLPPLWDRGRHGEGAGEAAPEQGDWARVLRDVRYLRIHDCGEGSHASGEPEQGSRDGSAVG
ncbi:uncharacterized protein LOC116939748 [Petromyzon marinus]|uniref:Uncharacterized protein LOC116939748 n=1 Tax=Petromyzon marinus TaxID=7757 RepID=A0AAJ7SRV5_PETMA|nr:uncharacterized protein LOC116939748 [Petromyzon marinus]